MIKLYKDLSREAKEIEGMVDGETNCRDRNTSFESITDDGNNRNKIEELMEVKFFISNDLQVMGQAWTSGITILANYAGGKYGAPV